MNVSKNNILFPLKNHILIFYWKLLKIEGSNLEPGVYILPVELMFF